MFSFQFNAFLKRDTSPREEWSTEKPLAALEAWLAALPILDHEKTSDALLEALQEYFHESLECEKAFEHLECYRPVVNKVCQLLHNKFTENVTLARHKRRQTVERAILLQSELAIAYTRLAYTHEKHPNPEFTAQCVQRALMHWNDVMLRHYQLYATLPTELWGKVYMLYKFATHNDFIRIKMEDPLSCPTQVTVEDEFKSILLLSSCNPYQLQPFDTGKLFRSLRYCAQFVELHTPAESNDLFAFDCNSDQAPSFLRFIKEPSSTTVGINTQKLNRELQHILTDPNTVLCPEQQSIAKSLSQYLLHHCQRAWCTFPTRAFTRTSANGEINATIGLLATHYHVSEKQDFLPKPATSDEPTLAPVTEIPTLRLMDIDHESIKIKPSNSAVSLLPKAKKTTSKEPSLHHWSLVNSSENGYCLCSTAQDSTDLQIGSLVALQEKASGGHWHIGLIRWIRYDLDEQIQIGIELVAPSARAVGAVRLPKSMMEQQYQRGLLLPPIDALNQAQSLLLPTDRFKIGDKLHVLSPTLDTDVMLTDCLKSEKQVQLFSFDIIRNF